VVTLPKLQGFLRRHRLVGLDSNILIYFIEAHPQYHTLCEKIFAAIEAGRNSGVCSTLSLLEILVQPYRNSDDVRVDSFYSLLTTYPHLAWVSLDTEIADLGAQLRAKYRLRTPDAIVLASALHAGASGFIANDEQFERIAELEVLIVGKS